MDNHAVKDKLLEYNGIIKESDQLYHQVAKAFGLPDCAFWILYSLREDNTALTQSDICSLMCQPKQTVNSSLKKMEKEGYITLTKRNEGRGKQINLTGKGIRLAEATVDQVLDIECSALSELEEKERDTFIQLFQKYTDILKRKMQRLNEN